MKQNGYIINMSHPHMEKVASMQALLADNLWENC